MSDDRAETPNPQNPSTKGATRQRQRATPLGRALRTVYDETLREDVPDDFMDLLRKLD